MKNTIQIYTDGCCIPNPGVGGWAAILIYGAHRKEITGGVKNTTNNRMELMAVIQALSSIKKYDLPIEVFTDSQYVRNGVLLWLKKWKKNNWRTSSKKPVKNQDLWVTLDTLVYNLKPLFNWVPGHSKIPENERADYLAKKATKELINDNPF